MPTVIAISNRKGGTGKTSLAACLGLALAALGYDSVLIDTDTQGSLSGLLGMVTDVGAVEETLYRVLVRKFPQPSSAEERRAWQNEGLKLWPADLTPLNINQALRDVPGGKIPIIPGILPGQLKLLPGYLLTDTVVREIEIRPGAYGIETTRELLSRPLADLPDSVDFVIFDSPPSYPLFTAALNIASDVVIVPTTTDYLSLTAAVEIEQIVELYRRAENPRLRLLGVVPTLTRRNTISHDAGMAFLRRRYGDLLMDDIPDRTVWRQAAWEAQTVLTYEPKGPAAEEAWNFVDSVLDRLEVAHNVKQAG